jgi:hypothetical protein
VTPAALAMVIQQLSKDKVFIDVRSDAIRHAATGAAGPASAAASTSTRAPATHATAFAAAAAAATAAATLGAGAHVGVTKQADAYGATTDALTMALQAMPDAATDGGPAAGAVWAQGLSDPAPATTAHADVRAPAAAVGAGGAQVQSEIERDEDVAELQPLLNIHRDPQPHELLLWLHAWRITCEPAPRHPAVPARASSLSTEAAAAATVVPVPVSPAADAAPSVPLPVLDTLMVFEAPPPAWADAAYEGDAWLGEADACARFQSKLAELKYDHEQPDNESGAADDDPLA